MITFFDRTGLKFPHDRLTPEDGERILATFSRRSISAVRNRALATVMYRSGLRHAEVLALKLKDIDLDKLTIRVLHGKGDKPRNVGMDTHTEAVLRLWLSKREDKGIPRDKPLFCTISKGNQGGSLNQEYVRQMISRAAKNAGLDKRVTPHTFRHACAADMYQETKDVLAIQQTLGHANLAATEKYLTTLSDNIGVEAIQSRTFPGTA